MDGLDGIMSTKIDQIQMNYSVWEIYSQKKAYEFNHHLPFYTVLFIRNRMLKLA
jgi:hypothetical protein